ncbi:FadR family transcriptional regulator [Mycobacterium sp. WUMAC-067]|uniref:FadR/GntR family transcriptional regulator n=1 Tax=unclassified Mycobacterium TaxID=2642494 RepID=UPI001CD92D07|nr:MULTISPECIES: FCD domain-containing protein [unclassified Mycobacterium]MCA2244769.1 FadR family transcriptional regulator [Mycobacterium sp. WUMAC-067]MCA2315979.1 FadR family transcriptional regulator [Mycobacterium sp. WUMAC-025]
MADGKRTAGIEKPQQIAQELRDLIVSGVLKEGESLGREPEVVARFGVSRPSLREALRILEAERLIEVVRGVNGGVFVRAPDSRTTARTAAILLRSRNVSLADVFEARSLIEPIAAKAIAARRKGRRSALTHLRYLLDDQRRTIDDLEAFGVANLAFHEALVSLGGNTTLSMFAETINQIVAHALINDSRGDPVLAVTATRRRDLRSQERLLEIIEAGDADRAEAHWRAHMAALGRVILGTNASSVVELIPANP